MLNTPAVSVLVEAVAGVVVTIAFPIAVSPAADVTVPEMVPLVDPDFTGFDVQPENTRKATVKKKVNGNTSILRITLPFG
jgi:hypothetical protein